MDNEGRWENFRPFESAPNINWNDPDLHRIDLDGDGFPDLLLTRDHCFVCYPSRAEKGFGPSYETLQSFEEEDGHRIVFSDPGQSVYLADMSGDGLTDLVRIKNGPVCYWPNKGYGNFGAKVSLDNTPWFDPEDRFNQQRIRLADVDGSGTTDMIYLADDCVKYFPNQSDNALREEVVISQRLPMHARPGRHLHPGPAGQRHPVPGLVFSRARRPPAGPEVYRPHGKRKTSPAHGGQ